MVSFGQVSLDFQESGGFFLGHPGAGHARVIGHHLGDDIFANLKNGTLPRHEHTGPSLDSGGRFIDQVDGFVGEVAVRDETH